MLPGVVPASSYQPPKPIWDRFIRYSDCLRLSLPISFVPGHLEKRQMLKSPHPFPTALQCDTSDTWTPLSASCIHLMFLLLFLLRSNLPGSVWSWSAESTRQPWQPGQLGPGLCLFCFVLFRFEMDHFRKHADKSPAARSRLTLDRSFTGTYDQHPSPQRPQPLLFQGCCTRQDNLDGRHG